MKVLVTGASGFVGRVLCADLIGAGVSVCEALRRSHVRNAHSQDEQAKQVVIGDIDATTDWSAALTGIDAVIHLAARVHVMHDREADPLHAFRTVNVAGTERLARMAAAAGVRRFVYVSTVKVHGESTQTPANEFSKPIPGDPYGVSKWEAEQALQRIAADTGMEVVIVRPPLVYGPGVGANFLRLMRWVDRRMPLPLAGVHNRRSLIYVGNLSHALITCLRHANAANHTYLVSDGPAVSTAELIRTLSRAFDRQARLFYVPPACLRFGARLFGKQEELNRLIGSMEVDSSRIRNELDWRSPTSFETALNETVDWYKNQR